MERSRKLKFTSAPTENPSTTQSKALTLVGRVNAGCLQHCLEILHSGVGRPNEAVIGPGRAGGERRTHDHCAVLITRECGALRAPESADILHAGGGGPAKRPPK